MRVVYATKELPDEVTCAVFLLGPTPRADLGPAPSWRPEAIQHLTALGFQGQVFVPEPQDGNWPADAAAQIDWEDRALNRADRILAWLPPDAAAPGLTADEWGYWMGRDPARLVLCTPPGAAHARYQQEYARRLGVPVVTTLAEACAAAASDPGERRTRGECEVPLHVWRTASFQSWYDAQKKAGNTLLGARVEWVYRAGERREVLFWALQADVYVAAERRRKSNEVVVGRPDVTAALLYRPGRDWLDTEVVLVREFRSPEVTSDGYIWEFPGGTIPAGRDAAEAAADEVAEEVGLRLPPRALRVHGVRQLAGTVSAHQAHVFSAELSADQVAGLRAEEAAGVAHGRADETERTFVRVRTVRQVLDETPADWATLGIVLAVLRELDSTPPPA